MFFSTHTHAQHRNTIMMIIIIFSNISIFSYIDHRDRYTITIFPDESDGSEESDEDNEIIIFNATKIPVFREKTFMQKYGTFIFIGFFILCTCVCMHIYILRIYYNLLLLIFVLAITF